MPELGAALGVPVGAFLLDPHGRGEDQVGGLRGHGWVGFGHNDEVVRVSIARKSLLVEIRRRLKVVVNLHPIRVDNAILEHPVVLDGMEPRLCRYDTGRQLPYLLGEVAVLWIVDNQVGR